MVGWTGEEIVILPKHGEWSMSDGDIVLAVSDGIGGSLYGERASHLALETFTNRFSQTLLARGPDNPIRGAETRDFLETLLVETHAAVNHEAAHYQECLDMGATFTALWLRPTGTWWIVHVGDSRCYHWRRGNSLKQLTQDHNYAGYLFREGKINERELRNHPTGHSLTQALGGGLGKIYPQVNTGGYMRGDRFLLCSDGLTEGLWDKHLTAALEPIQGDLLAPMQGMLDQSLQASGRDNITLILSEVG